MAWLTPSSRRPSCFRAVAGRLGPALGLVLALLPCGSLAIAPSPNQVVPDSQPVSVSPDFFAETAEELSADYGNILRASGDWESANGETSDSDAEGRGSPVTDALPSAPEPQTPPLQTTDAQKTEAQAKADARQVKKDCRLKPCPRPFIDWYMRFENGPQVKPLTPKEKAWLATKNVIDPFNMITILGEAGLSVAADPDSPVGPGFPGWGRAVGISFTEDITGEFVGTFLICSIAHQDPHYHRTPTASYKRRIFHAIAQVVWTKGDDGKGMLNYANLVGFAIDDEIANLYVPGRQTNAEASAQRYGIGLATAPIDNFVTEFLPDVAKHIHVQVVVVQRIINQIASKDSTGS